jgi:hypothetical protein
MTRPNVASIYGDELRNDALAEDPNCPNIRARFAGRLKAHAAGAAEPPEAYVLREGRAGPQPREGEAT